MLTLSGEKMGFVVTLEGFERIESGNLGYQITFENERLDHHQ